MWNVGSQYLSYRERNNELAHGELYQHRMIYWWWGIIYQITAEARAFDISVVYLHFRNIVLSPSCVSWNLSIFFQASFCRIRRKSLICINYYFTSNFDSFGPHFFFLRLLLILYIILSFFMVLLFALKYMIVWTDFGQESWDMKEVMTMILQSYDVITGMKRVKVEWPWHAAYRGSRSPYRSSPTCLTLASLHSPGHCTLWLA